MAKGKLIILEGIDKCGKSGQLHRLIGYLLGKEYEVVEIKEPPHPDPVLEIPDFRKEIMDLRKNRPDLEGTELAKSEFELFVKPRAALYQKVVLPALNRGAIVVSDRGPDSSRAFQGHGRGMNLEFIKEINHKATQGVNADLTFLFDLAPQVAMKRITKEDQINRFESEPMEFFQKVRNGYLVEAERHNIENIKRWEIINADDEQHKITKKVIKAVQEQLGL